MRDSLVYRSVAETHVNIVLCQYTKWVREDIENDKTGDAQLHIAANPFNMKTAPKNLQDLIEGTDAIMDDQIHLYNPATSPEAILKLGKAFHTYPLRPFVPNDKLKFTIPVFQLKIMERIINGFEEKGGANRVAMKTLFRKKESGPLDDAMYEARQTILLKLVKNAMEGVLQKLCNPNDTTPWVEAGDEFKETYKKGIESIDTFVSNKIKGTIGKYGGVFADVLTLNLILSKIPTTTTSITVYVDLEMDDLLSLNKLITHINVKNIDLIVVYIQDISDEKNTLGPYVMRFLNQVPRVTVRFIRGSVNLEAIREQYGFYFPQLLPDNITPLIEAKNKLLKSIKDKNEEDKGDEDKGDDDEYNLCNSK